MPRFERIACCWGCWHRARPTRAPVVIKNPDKEFCGLCGHQTRSGIYVRAEVMPEGSSHRYRVPDWKHPWPEDPEPEEVA